MAVEVALRSQNGRWGFLNNISIPFGSKVIIGLIFLDFTLYMQHVIFHRIPLLWRLHRMHHANLDFDVTTGIRFHPIEIFISMCIKMFVVAGLGISAVGVIIFEILLNGTSMFNHGNIYIPERVDKVIRLFLVTPDMHRVHHSVKPTELNTNFGFNFPWWDRLFWTYTPQPEDGHTKMIIGLHQFRELRYLKLHWLLIQPFLQDGKKETI
jgi:sterol desaturase/sphingolipid hydroxylase (fatty acid hydroxylase superfamily)